MTLKPLSIRLVSIAFASMTAACATPPQTSAAPPRLLLPQTATTPCRLDRLGEHATLADLETSYAARGAALVLCDAARRLAVDTLIAERALQDRQTRPVTPGRRRIPGL